MNVKDIEQVELGTQKIEALLEHAKSRLEEEHYATLEQLAKSAVSMTELLSQQGMTIRQLRRLVFGSKSEKRRDLYDDVDGDHEDSGSEDSSEAEDEEAETSGADSSTGDGGENAEGGENAGGEEPPKQKRKGHGRNGASKYKGAEHFDVEHETLNAGDSCPQPGCTGRLYAIEPSVLVRVVGQPPLGAKVIILEQLRCSLCLTVFKATPPEDLGAEKYDESAAAMIAILRYGTGVAHNRLEELQGNLEVPLPSSTQWDVVERAAPLVLPAYEELIRQAAQGDVLHNDDTKMKILSVIKELKEKRKKEKEERCDGG